MSTRRTSRENTLSGMDFVAETSRRSVPSIDFRQSIRNFAGVRANTSESDFIIRPAKNMPRLLHIAGIKSPGLSSSARDRGVCRRAARKHGRRPRKKDEWNGRREQIRFKQLSDEEKAALIAKDPRYGRVICRCETITEGEIVAAIHSPIPPCSLDGIKRRAGSGMGRCQGRLLRPRACWIFSRVSLDAVRSIFSRTATAPLF
ncbi:MAG: (2Fe-2S)-binding protein [Butyricicoccaceae bacterium]